MNNITKGLKILIKYYPSFTFRIILERMWYATYEPEKISTEDLDELVKLGWEEDSGAWSYLKEKDVEIGYSVHTPDGDGIVDKVIYTYPVGLLDAIAPCSVLVLINNKLTYYAINQINLI